VYGREKKPFSIWRKMENRQISLEQLSDIYGFRIVVDGLDACYRALGIVHSAWRAVPGRFKDYVSTPKQNNYQSIHTTVVGPRHQWVELQIRTREMDQIAEYGVAAHALYKDGGDGAVPNGSGLAQQKENPYIWLRRLVDTLLEATTPRSSSSTPSSSCSRTRCSVSRRRAGSSPCRAAPRPSILPMPCTPTSATPASAPSSTGASCRSPPSSRTATRWRS
jgi:(p)ppGpp synthase/HD superfamily hydrolase